MSEFFRALERAERECAARRSSEPSETPVASGRLAAVEEAPVPIPASTMPAADRLPPVTPSTMGEEPPVEARPVMRAPTATASTMPKSLTSFLGASTRTATELDEHMVSLITPDTFEADQYRVLRHTVEQRRRTAGLAIVAVTSAGPGDGKTTTAINLAGALAQDRGARILLVDCDLRSSAMARRLGLAEGRSLVQAIVDPMLTLDDAIRHLPRYNLDVMAAGFETASPYELLKSPRLGDLFEAARRRYDYVVVDTPPVVPFPDCRVLSKIVDGFLLVVTAHRTPRRLVDEALGVLPKESGIGVVFTGDDAPLPRAYHAYYGQDDAGTGAPTWRSSARRVWARVGGGA